MKRERIEYRKPYGRGDYELHRGGEGVYWQAGNGVLVRLAAAELPAGGARDQRSSELSLGEVSALEAWPTVLAR